MTDNAALKTTTVGIDPGSINCGWGVLEKAGSSVRFVAAGTIAMPKQKPLAERLKILHEGLTGIFDRFRPDSAAVEDVFYGKNIKAAFVLGHARGVALAAAALAGVTVTEYSPTTVKKAVTGYGRAEKEQVQKMISAILGIREALLPDSADALSVALCHINTADLAGLNALDPRLREARIFSKRRR
jgi:crossover junction endodeoxyribonuclease RuvC